eukprot:TRINITY_DN18545_c0_g1_i1.p2 TRINITY_DN18545_c0_g1~~TRINITY_DN18545_c0_g1_i1.p2  ORF type:complete len:149 (+),score=5.49 TRINITY_DN18545_c0_g1_i1:1-447(+)
MRQLVSGSQELTLFAPVNSAVEAFYKRKNLNPAFRDFQSTALLSLLKYHVLGYKFAHKQMLQQTNKQSGTWLANEGVTIKASMTYVPENFRCRGKYCSDQGNKITSVKVIDARKNQAKVISSLFNACKITVHIIDLLLLPSSLQIHSS